MDEFSVFKVAVDQLLNLNFLTINKIPDVR